MCRRVDILNDEKGVRGWIECEKGGVCYACDVRRGAVKVLMNGKERTCWMIKFLLLKTTYVLGEAKRIGLPAIHDVGVLACNFLQPGLF